MNEHRIKKIIKTLTDYRHTSQLINSGIPTLTDYWEDRFRLELEFWTNCLRVIQASGYKRNSNGERVSKLKEIIRHSEV